MKRSRLVLVVILTLVTVLCISLWIGEGPLWRWVMLEKEAFEIGGDDPLISHHGSLRNHKLIGWGLQSRWRDKNLRDVAYYAESGFKAWDVDYRLGATIWELNGKVSEQALLILDTEGEIYGTNWVHGPPWLWGMTDQTRPTAPWWGEEKD